MDYVIDIFRRIQRVLLFQQIGNLMSSRKSPDNDQWILTETIFDRGRIQVPSRTSHSRSHYNRICIKDQDISERVSIVIFKPQFQFPPLLVLALSVIINIFLFQFWFDNQVVYCRS
jgi:hypothetical protein